MTIEYAMRVTSVYTYCYTRGKRAHRGLSRNLKREIFTKFEYFTFGQIEQILKKYVVFYNQTRIHGLVGKITPMEKWEMDKNMILNKKIVA